MRNRPRSSSPTTPMASTGNAGSSRFRSSAMLKPEPPPWRSMSKTSLEVSSLGQRAIDLLKSTHHVPADSTPRRSVIFVSGLLQNGFGDFAVLLEIPQGPEAFLPQRLVIVLDGFERRQRAVRDGPHKPHDVERRFGEIDLAAEQGDARAMLLRLIDELETVAGGARPSPEHADHEARIERRQLLERFRPVIGDLEETRALGLGEAREAADDRIIDEMRHLVRREAALDIRVEHFEEVRHPVPGGVGAKILERLERDDVGIDVVGEGNRIEAEIGQWPHMRERSAAK